MSLELEEDDGGGIPEWVVTFGDMMSLLLTFFIMLVSLSEIKEEEEYQALVESIKRQLGHSNSVASMTPGPVRPRNAPMQKLASMGRSKIRDLKRGGQDVKAVKGENPRVEIIVPGRETAVGTSIPFPEGIVDLPSDQLAALSEQALQFLGKRQRIVIRGHTSRRPVQSTDEISDHWDLAYQRCLRTKRFLVETMGIAEDRIRISVAGPNEPVYTGTDPKELARNPRVQVFIIDEVVRRNDGN